jgi:phosphatidylserine/phosphatidylglycerophosphate/cardiolipin synthase-like enzyme
MQRVLTNDLWKAVVAQARRARRKSAAIAYATQDLLGLGKGDTLLVDSSLNAVRHGETSAKLLRTLHQKGVSLYECPRLHAKVVLLDDVAVIGSGNMSGSSVNALVEAGVITDHSSTVAGVASFIEQLIAQSKELTAKDIDHLCKIKVVRRGGFPIGGTSRRRPKVSRLGTRTWVVGIRELVKEHRQPNND